MSVPNPTGLIEFFTHPPIKSMSPHRDTFGPYGGMLTLIHYQISLSGGGSAIHNPGDSGGIYTLATTIPNHYSVNAGWSDEDDIYDESVFGPPLAQIVVQHQFAAGTWVTTQVVAIDRLRVLITWDYGVPARLGFYAQPLVEIDLYYLMTGVF